MEKSLVWILSLVLVFITELTDSRVVEQVSLEDLKPDPIIPVKFWTYEQKKQAYEEDRDLLLSLKESSEIDTALEKRSSKKYGKFNFYNQLSDYEKYIYDTVYEASTRSPPEFNVLVYSEYVYSDPINATELTDYYLNDYMYRQIKVFSSLIYENPQLWWIGQLAPDFVPYNETHIGIKYNINAEAKYQQYAPEDVKKLNKKIKDAKDKIVKHINKMGLKTKYAIVRYIHDYLVANIVYTDGLTHSYDLYGSIVEKAAVCEGYSEAFQYLAQQFGINAIIARSYWHEWNFVEMDNNKYYIIDVTHDDPYVKGPDGNSTSAPLKCSTNIIRDYFLTGTKHNSTKGILYEDEYYHELIYNPFRYPTDYMDMFKYPKIEKKDYSPSKKEKAEAKLVDEYISEKFDKCKIKVEKPKKTKTKNAESEPTVILDNNTNEEVVFEEETTELLE